MASHSRRRPLAIGIVFALAAVISVAPSAMATFPGRNGPITFMRQDENGFWQTWVARADLSHEVQVTHLRANSGWSAWSPDGSRIAINTDVNDPTQPMALVSRFGTSSRSSPMGATPGR